MSTVHDLVQGTEPWLQFRLTKRGASEAAAMLGMSPKVTRAELLRMKHTGRAQEFSEWLQTHVLEAGHEVEALARPHAEAFVTEELFPCTYANGLLSASCDGITLDESVAWEHKSATDENLAIVRAGRVPEHHMPQCQQVLMVTGADKLLFTVSDGTPERMAHVWVLPDPAWFQRLRDGWALFERDLAAYVLPEPAAAAPVGQAPETLPALRIEITGAVTASNLAEFKATALGAIRSVNRDLTTDQHFADAERAVKWCGEVESRLAAAKEHALSQTATIDALFKTIDEISAEARRVRLDLDKLVTRRKTEVKDEAIVKARRALDAHIATLNGELAPFRVPQPVADFAGAIKGKRSIASMQDALDGVLAVAKIAAEADARAMRANLAAFNSLALADDFGFLFPDLHQIVHKAADDFAAVVRSRIATHKAAEAEKERQRKVAEDARVAAEAARQAAVLVEQQRLADAAAAAAAVPPPAPSVPETAPIVAAAPAVVAAPAPIVSRGVRFVSPPPAAPEPATLRLGDICGRLGFTMTSAFVAESLAVSPQTVGALKLYRESDFARICSALQNHVAKVYAAQREAVEA